MKDELKIYSDDTIACMLSDLVRWSRTNSEYDYEIPEELRNSIEKEIYKIREKAE